MNYFWLIPIIVLVILGALLYHTRDRNWTGGRTQQHPVLTSPPYRVPPPLWWGGPPPYPPLLPPILPHRGGQYRLYSKKIFWEKMNLFPNSTLVLKLESKLKIEFLEKFNIIELWKDVLFVILKKTYHNSINYLSLQVVIKTNVGNVIVQLKRNGMKEKKNRTRIFLRNGIVNHEKDISRG